MALHEVVLKATFNSFFTDLTRRFPSAKILVAALVPYIHLFNHASAEKRVGLKVK